MQINVPTPSKVLRLRIDVVDAEVPWDFSSALLLGLDKLDENHLQVLSISNELEHLDCPSSSWRIPLTRNRGHVSLTFCPVGNTASTFYTRAQLQRLYRNLYHPSVSALMNLLRKARRYHGKSNTEQDHPQLDWLTRFSKRDFRSTDAIRKHV